MQVSPLDVVTGLCSLVPDGRVVDLGAGSGRNAVYMARLGLQVDVLDNSPQALGDIATYAHATSLPIHTIEADLSHSEPIFTRYAAVVCTYVLHYLQPSRALELLQFFAYDEHAPPIQAIGVITRQGDFFPQFPNRFFAECGFVQTLYHSDRWRIVAAFEEERLMIARHPDGRCMRNTVAFLLVERSRTRRISA